MKNLIAQSLPSVKNADAGLIVYVHVPKTAGTTVNHLLRSWSVRGRDHCEWLINDPEALKREVSSLDWISGHLQRPVLLDALSAATNRPLRVFSLVRDPVSQIKSHYNWLIEIYHKGREFYIGHPPNIQEISQQIRSTDNRDPEAIIANLQASPGLFLNQQSRCILGKVDATLSNADIRQSLRNYEFVASEQKLPKMLFLATGLKPTRLPRRNQSRYHFDPLVFHSPPMLRFLSQAHSLDQRLYEVVVKMSRGRWFGHSSTVLSNNQDA